MGWIRRTIRFVYVKLGADFEVPTPLPDTGRFPSITQSLLWDLLPQDVAPDADGVLAPRPPDVTWVKGLPVQDLEFRYEVAKAAREYRLAAVAEAENKASRLLAPTITLLAACAALAAFQLSLAHSSRHPLIYSVSALPSAIALLFFAVSAVRSLDTDIRVGYSKLADVRRESSPDVADFLRESISLEVLGAYWAAWSAAQKKGSLMQARAWFTRGLVSLVLALAVAAAFKL